MSHKQSSIDGAGSLLTHRLQIRYEPTRDWEGGGTRHGMGPPCPACHAQLDTMTTVSTHLPRLKPCP